MFTLKSIPFLLLSLSLLLAACNSTPLAERFSCTNSDWYEIGRRDGASGVSIERIHSYQNKCGSRLEAQSEDMYRNGRNAGLVEYCTSRNGFELGRMNISYNDVCPAMTEQKFLKSYDRGMQARILDQENKKISSQLEKLAEQMSLDRMIKDDEKEKIASQIEILKKQQSINQQELSKFTK